MQSFKKTNDLIGWLMFFIAMTVYTLTVEQTASFWDCGEFIAVSYKLMVPHPPGAPLFLLIGRMFSFLAMGNVENVAYWINMVSVLASAFTILFLYWSIVLLAKKMILPNEKGEYELPQQISIFASGIVGALAYTFSDSFWFSAVEAEVYGMSSFFTAFVVWAMLKWETIKDARYENQWLLMIAYTVGLSIGVHLLNLVTIPALALIYFFKKYKPSLVGMIAALGAGLVIVGIIMVGVIPGLPSIAGKFEIVFVNNLGLPFGSGAVAFTILFLGALVYGIRYSIQKKNVLLNTVLLSFAFVLIGYASYAIVLIRSNYNPPIDENDPENIMSFVSYLKREQYGDRPLLYGRSFMSERTEGSVKQGDPIYVKGEKKYEIADYSTEVDYEDKVLLPRMYSQSGNHPQLYQQWGGLKEKQKPTLFHNLYYMFNYQIGHMYVRYFLWNFVGRDGDEKEADWLSPLAPTTDLPEAIKNNKARDNFYALPLILGILGLLFQLKRHEQGFLFVGMVFILTGVAIVVYLNSPPVEPRERDYIYVGSFYAFAMWIGFGVLALSEYLGKIVKNNLQRPIIAGVLCLFVPIMMGAKGWDNHNRAGRYHSIDQAKNTLRSCAPNAILFTGGDNDTFPLWYVQDVEGFRTDVRVVVLSYFSTDWYIKQMKRQAYLSTPLPITFTDKQVQAGRNEYLPYIEKPELKGGIDLQQYINLIKSENPNIQIGLQGGGQTAFLPSKTLVLKIDKQKLEEKGLIPPQKQFEAIKNRTKQIMDSLVSNKKIEIADFEAMNNVYDSLFLTVKNDPRFKNTAVVSDTNSIIPKGKEDQVVDQMTIRLMDEAGALYKSDLMILDMLANFDWSRPIYFNNTSANTANIDLRQYLHMEGMAYRLLPVKASEDSETEGVNAELMYENMKKFEFRGFDNPNAYHDDEYKKFGANLRSCYLRLAREFQENDNDATAKEILDLSLKNIPDASIPYDYYIPQYVEMYHQLGENEKALALADLIGKRSKENLEYLIRFNADNFANSDLKYKSLMTLQQLRMVYRRLSESEKRRSELEIGNLESKTGKEESKKRFDLYAKKFQEYEKIVNELSQKKPR